MMFGILHPEGNILSKLSIAIFLAMDATVTPLGPVVVVETVRKLFSAVPSFVSVMLVARKGSVAPPPD